MQKRRPRTFFSSTFTTREQKDQLSRVILARARKGDFDGDLNPANKDGFINYWRTVSELGDASQERRRKGSPIERGLAQTRDSTEPGNKLGASATATESDAATRLRFSSLLAKEGHPAKDLRLQIEQAVLKSIDFDIFGEEGGTLKGSIKRIANSESANEAG